MSKSITVTSPNGVTLKTKNKYVDDDVNISVFGAGDIIASNIKSGATILGVQGGIEIWDGSLTGNGMNAEYVLKKMFYGHKAIFITNYTSTSNTYGTTIQLEAINNGS